ncbi:heme/hemin ABC transporter substrate-binding protein [Orrella sp. 11846]|uniref:heme/hemin ABC transporter substrate-binding protein n=1 Tax=Orrella sp. 11846 TaxID=3409913 RepID=UPI003B5A22DD
MRFGLNTGRKLAALAASLISFCALADADQKLDSTRLVTLGGPVTEIVYALGQEGRLVGTDLSSVYPVQAQELPSVGYYRRLPPEGVASLNPTLVIASENAGPPQVLEQLKTLGIPVVMVSDKPSLDSMRQRVKDVAKVLDVQEKGDEIIDAVFTEMDKVSHKPEKPVTGMTVVLRGGTLLGAGGDTAANLVLESAGVSNVLSDVQSFRPLSAEIVSALAPEMIVVTTSTVDAMGGLDAVKKSPVLSMTPAVKNDKVVVLDDLLAQAFGLRLPQAIKTVRDGAFGADQ